MLGAGQRSKTNKFDCRQFALPLTCSRACKAMARRGGWPAAITAAGNTAGGAAGGSGDGQLQVGGGAAVRAAVGRPSSRSRHAAGVWGAGYRGE